MRVLLWTLLVCTAIARPLDPDFKPSLGRRANNLIHDSQLLQLERHHAKSGDEEIVGGFGVQETPEIIPQGLSQRPLSSLLEEDEGAEMPCDDCSAIAGIPEGFSGDLNELAELAYLPPTNVRAEAARRHQLLHPLELPPDDNKGNGEKFLGMRRGDEMVGGFGVQEQDGIEIMNLELGEGSTPPEAAPAPVSHKTDMLKRDLAAKQHEIEQLSAQLEHLKAEKLDAERRVQTTRESEDSVIERTRAEKDAELEQVKIDYANRIMAAKSSGTQRVAKVSEVEGHIAERRLSDEETAAQKERERASQELAAKTAALDKLKAVTAKAEHRADELYSKAKLNLFSDSGEETMGVVDGGLRSTLKKLEGEKEEIEQEEEAEDESLRNLSAQAREEAQAKRVLESRLKGLRAREEAVKAEERQYEVANANLHHEIDEEEVAGEENAEGIARARQTQRDAPAAASSAEEAQLSNEERQYEQATLKAAQDEIVRLKGELAKREREEEHAEEELLQQERTVTAEADQARDIATAARNLKDQAESRVGIELFDAKQAGEEMVREAEAVAETVRKEARAEELEDGKADRVRVEAAQKVRASQLKQQEAETKREANEAREKLEEELQQAEAAEKAAFEAEKATLTHELHEATEERITAYRHSKEEELNDKSADLVMATIHSGKNDEQLKELKQQNEQLKAALSKLEKQIEQQKREWAFQELAAQQNIQFSGLDEDY